MSYKELRDTSSENIQEHFNGSCQSSGATSLVGTELPIEYPSRR
jgi:hypothetical protein